MRALILAGGLGTRLRSIVSEQPKPMADIESKPFLAHQIEYLKAQGISQVVLCVGYLHEHVMSYFGSGEKWDIPIAYSVESSPLGTGGALKHAERYINDTFLLLNGDSFFDIDLSQLVEFHEAKKTTDPHGIGTVALAAVPDVSRYGSVQLDDDLQILNFIEKGALGLTDTGEVEATSGLINAGIYVLEPGILAVIPSAQKVSIERTVFPWLINNDLHLYGYESDDFFVDIGTPEGYYEFCTYVRQRSNGASNEQLSRIGA